MNNHRNTGDTETRLCSSPIGVSRTRLRTFSKGRISKEIPPGPAVTRYFEVPARHRSRSGEAGGCASVPLGVSRHFVKPQNIASPPTQTVDATLPPASRAYGPEGEKGRGLAMKQRSSFTGANIESSFHEQSSTIPSRPAGSVLKPLNHFTDHSLQFFHGYLFHNRLANALKQHEIYVLPFPLFILSHRVKQSLPIKLNSGGKLEFLE